jgi:CDP-glucose 4,6-dehydratase
VTWSGKRVLVTGHTGFKGAWLAWWLSRSGAAVTGYALPADERRPNLFRALRLDAAIESALGDVRDRSAVRRFVERVKPDAVFHLAAQALVRAAYADPAGTFETNVAGTAALLDAVRTSDSVRAVVVVTSDKCYLPRSSGAPYREDDPLGGYDPYGASKAAQEIVAAAYRSSYFAGGPLLATVRAGNVIGGGDWSADRLVPDAIDALLGKAPLVLRYPDAVRPWQHVLEPLHAYLVVAERLLAGDAEVASAFNVGPGESGHRTVAEVIDLLYAAWGRAPAWERAAGIQPAEAPVLRLDAGKAARALSIVPRFGLEVACRRTAEWYRAWSQGADARALCDADIDAFAGPACSA